MYDKGEGVPENDKVAIMWYRKAAEQGLITAQFLLGGMYFTGEGVPEDYLQAYAWFNLAAAQGEEAAAEMKNTLRNRMTPSQIERAQELSADMHRRITPTIAPD